MVSAFSMHIDVAHVCVCVHVCAEKPIQSVHITSPFIRYQPPLTESSVSDKCVVAFMVSVAVTYISTFCESTSPR